MDIVQCGKWGGEISVIIFIVGRRFIVKGGRLITRRVSTMAPCGSEFPHRVNFPILFSFDVPPEFYGISSHRNHMCRYVFTEGYKK